MTISHRAVALHMNADLLSHHPLPNNTENTEGVGEVDIVEIFGLHVVDLALEFFAEIAEGYKTCRGLNMISKNLERPDNSKNHTLVSSLSDEHKELFNAVIFNVEDELLYQRK